MTPCNEPKCAALAGPSGKCPPHAKGYRLNDKGEELRCSNCRRLILKGHWYQQRDEGMYHIVECKTHPEVAAERVKELAR